MVLGLGLVLVAAGGCRLLLVTWLADFGGWGSSGFCVDMCLGFCVVCRVLGLVW